MVFGGTQASTAASHASCVKLSPAANAPSSAMLTDLGASHSAATARASNSSTRPRLRSSASIPSGYSAAPIFTVTGSIFWLLTTMRPPSRRKGSARAASISSKATIASASPSVTSGESTFSPTRTCVITSPPRCDMPCTSLTLISSPASIASLPSTRLASRMPCPPTPTMIISFFISAPLSKARTGA